MRLVLAGLAFAATEAGAFDVRPVVKSTLEFGGDTLATVGSSNGSPQTIRANEMISIGGGASVLNDDRSLELELTLSFKAEEIWAVSSDVEWRRWPLDALVFYRWPKFRLGGGPTLHLAPRLRTGGSANNLNIAFKDALGLVLQGDYLLKPNFGLGVRYTLLEYKATGPIPTEAKSNGFGLNVSARF